MMPNKKIPIVFAFDDNYALPASIAIQSLLDAKNSDTEYDVFVMHGGLQKSTMQKIEKIYPINWVYVDNSYLQNVPATSNWPLSVYYRLLIADLIPQYDKIIWSDVDVLFCDDLTNIYNISLENADWAGVIAERRDEKNGIHQHFPKNKKPFIYMSGFMVINAQQWREKQILQRFMDVIAKYNNQLKMFDLETLNLAANKIIPVSFEYCVLENIYDDDDITKSPEYPWLSQVHSHDTLMHAKQNPVIIHYAGKWPKIWLRKHDEIPPYYWQYIQNSPFYNREFYFPGWRTKLYRGALWVAIKLCPVKSWRQKMKQIRKVHK